MASSRRKLDEKHLKLIRELGSQADNRTCFDCHQRGTTYINMTVGSFVCTSCSGILRGINPPHRVKSISMASFTAEEIQLIKSKGNQYCSAVWLGLYDAQRNPFPETKDEHKIRDFMITKYEKKRFYVDPSIALKNMPPATNSPGSSSNASTPSSDNKSTVARPAVSRPNVPTSQSSGSLGVILSSVAVSGSKSSTPKSQSSIDLLAECLHGSVTAPASTTTSDPFAGAPTSTPAAPQTADALNKQESFANFENANIFTNTAAPMITSPLISAPTQHIRFPTAKPTNQTPGNPPNNLSSTNVTQNTNSIASVDLISSTLNATPSAEPIKAFDINPANKWEAFEDNGITCIGTPLIPPDRKIVSRVNTNRVDCEQFASNNNLDDLKDYESKKLSIMSSSFKERTRSFSNSVSSAALNSNLIYRSKTPEKKKSTPLLLPTLSIEDRELNTNIDCQQVCKLPIEDKSVKDNFSHKIQEYELEFGKNDNSFSNSTLDIDESKVEIDLNLNTQDCLKILTSKANTVRNVKSNEITSKCFAAFLSSTSKLSGTSYQNFGSEKNQSVTDIVPAVEAISLNKGASQNEVDDNIKNTDNNPFKLNEIGKRVIESEKSLVFDNAPLFLKKKGDDDSNKSDEQIARICKSVSETKSSSSSRGMSDTLASSSSSCSSKSMNPVLNVSVTAAEHATSHQSSTTVTNPFISDLQSSATNTILGSSNNTKSSSSSSTSHLVCSVCMMHVATCMCASKIDTNNYKKDSAFSMLTNPCVTWPVPDTTSTSSSTAMSAAPAPMAPSTFSNAPLLPLNPSSSSSSALPANGTAAPTATPASAVSASDRYAALKDLDEVFRTAKEEPPAPAPPPQTNGGAPWGTANSNNQSSNSATVFGSPPNGGVFGSPSTSAFGGFMNGGNGVFGTPPGTNNTGGSFFPQQAVTQNTAPTASQPWTANFSGQNPFGGGSSNNTWMNGGNSAFGAPTPNGGSNAFGAPTQNGSSNAFGTPTPNGGSNAFGTPATNGVSTAFGVPTPNQQNFTQPNPFGTSPDPNFNQFGAGVGGINGINGTNGSWSNFNQQQQPNNNNAKMQWANSNGAPATANPFMTAPQMPSNGTSFNPFL